MEQKYDVFISYSPKDYVDENMIPGNVVSQIMAAFIEEDISFIFERDFFSSPNINENTISLIKASSFFLLITTVNSYHSERINKEIAVANSFGKHLISLYCDATLNRHSIAFYTAPITEIDYLSNPQQAIKVLIQLCKNIRQEEYKRMLQTRLSIVHEKLDELSSYYQQSIYSTMHFASLPNLLISDREEKCYLYRLSQLLNKAEYIHNDIQRLIETDAERCKYGIDELRRLLSDAEAIRNEYENFKKTHNQPVVKETYAPQCVKQKSSILHKLTRWYNNHFKHTLYDVAYGSIFAPAEIRRRSHMLVQVYLHLETEIEQVKNLAKESQQAAERRDFIPLQCRLKKGDKVDIFLYINGKTLLFYDKKSIIWQGSFTKCSYDYFVPQDIDATELSCKTILTINNVPIGEMQFITSIVYDVPRPLNPEIIAHNYSKVFISYAHQDESKVKFLAEGFKISNTDYFFDRHYLKAGDIYPIKIQEYINAADLFILCWSKNASQSEYVAKELAQALERACPNLLSDKDRQLTIYPMSITPKTDLPANMKEIYNFIEL